MAHIVAFDCGQRQQRSARQRERKEGRESHADVIGFPCE